MKKQYDDIKMVEKAIKEDDGIPTVRSIKKELDGKVSPHVIDAILGYLDAKNYIVTGSKGITWIQNDSPKLLRMIRKGVEM